MPIDAATQDRMARRAQGAAGANRRAARSWRPSRSALIALALFIGFLAAILPLRLVRNVSASLGGAYYIVAPYAPYGRDDTIAFAAPPASHYADLPAVWVKRVGGIAGDPLIRTPLGLSVGGRFVGSRAVDLPPIEGDAVPAGHVFALGDHEGSYDSRYAEVGFIPAAAILGRAFHSDWIDALLLKVSPPLTRVGEGS